MTATTELVVPRSIPMILLILLYLPPKNPRPQFSLKPLCNLSVCLSSFHTRTFASYLRAGMLSMLHRNRGECLGSEAQAEDRDVAVRNREVYPAPVACNCRQAGQGFKHQGLLRSR